MSPEGYKIARVVTPGLAEPPGATWSSCLVVGREIVMSGVTARGAPAVDAGEQARVVFARIKSMLEAAGGDVRNIYKMVIYATDAGAREGVNAARAAMFRAPFPASTFVVVKALASPDLLVEIDVFANLDVDLWGASA